jgi:hypothetical protein
LRPTIPKIDRATLTAEIRAWCRLQQHRNQSSRLLLVLDEYAHIIPDHSG